MDYHFVLFAALLGGLSAASLPLGSLLGLSWQPSNKIIGGMTAFGGGALIAALAVELVAPTAGHVVHAETSTEKNKAAYDLVWLIIGATVGGLLFTVLDNIINSKGGFLRNTSSTIQHFIKNKAARRREILEHLAASELVRYLPADLLGDILDNIRECHFEKGEVLFEEGEQGEEILFIENGIVLVTTGQKNIAELEAGDVVGEIALLTGDPRSATATAKEATNAFSLPKQYFDECRLKSIEFNEACKELAANRLSELVSKKGEGSNYQEWVSERIASLTEISVIPTDVEIKKASEEHGGAPMAIWLGILLDGIPESFVIGSALVISVTAAVSQSGADAVNLSSMIPYTLIAGLFLANFPEAMSSSIGMKKMGWGSARIFLMWGSLMVVTSIGASIGYWLGGSLDHSVIVLIEGLAAGAMLAMIASAMIPEAVHLGGGTVTGMSTLFGFLAAISFKLLE